MGILQDLATQVIFKISEKTEKVIRREIKKSIKKGKELVCDIIDDKTPLPRNICKQVADIVVDTIEGKIQN